MKVFFRVDASNCMGTGHLMRCLTLAEALRKRGAETCFICRAHPGNLLELLQRRAMPVTVLPAPVPMQGTSLRSYDAWLGVTQAEDAEQTIKALNGDRPDWLIVDHYGLNLDWEKSLHPHIGRLMVIDDLANRNHDCDLLLNQNYSHKGKEHYRGLVPESCHLFLGPRYALLKPEYAAYKRTLRLRDGDVRRVLVFFGGSDQDNLTGLALEALSQSKFQHLEVDVVVGTNNPNQKILESLAVARPRTRIHRSRPHLADLIAEADLGIGAGGATTWERMCLGLPSLVVSIAENQKPTCEALSRAGLIYYVGDITQVQVDHLRDAFEKWIGDNQRLLEISTQIQLVVDGIGAQRITEMIDPTSAERLWLRTAREDDIALYFNWANDPEVIRQAIHTEPILWVQHKEWFAKKLTDTRSHLFVLQVGSFPVGQIRFDQVEDEMRIDYSLDCVVRGRHWAGRLVSMGARMLQNSAPIHLYANVKETNTASCAVFMRLGFEEQPAPLGMRIFRSVSSRIAAVGSTSAFPISFSAG